MSPMIDQERNGLDKEREAQHQGGEAGAVDPWLAEGRAERGSPAGGMEQGWERRTIEGLLRAALDEQRRARRWRIFFRLLSFGLIVAILFIARSPDWAATELKGGRHTALIDIHGVIAADQAANARDIIEGLRKAYRDRRTAGIVLRINSPGGSPVQAGIINDEITRLRGLHPDIPVIAVVEDICASGGYYVAVAADAIYADKASMVGSIGVLMNGFGFVEALKKLGIERRLLVAGEHKGFLDPFTPLSKDDRRRVEAMLESIHRQFIAVVKRGRGDRLADNDELFSGLVWTGEQAVDLGLVDGLASVDKVAREVIHAERVVDYTQRELTLERLADRLGTRILGGVMSARDLR